MYFTYFSTLDSRHKIHFLGIMGLMLGGTIQNQLSVLCKLMTELYRQEGKLCPVKPSPNTTLVITVTVFITLLVRAERGNTQLSQDYWSRERVETTDKNFTGNTCKHVEIHLYYRDVFHLVSDSACTGF